MDGLTIAALTAGAALFIAFFPITVSLDVHLDLKARKLFFGVRLYGLLRLLGGYIEPRAEGIAVHLSRKKALLLPYGQMLLSRPDLNKLHGFHITEVQAITETGTDAHDIFLAAALLSLGNAAGAAFQGKCRIRNDVLLSTGTRLTSRIKVKFNLFAVLVLLIKLAMEAFITWMEEKKSTIS